MISRVLFITTDVKFDGPAQEFVDQWADESTTPLQAKEMYARVRTSMVAVKANLDRVENCDLVAYVDLGSGLVWHVARIVGAYRTPSDRVATLCDPTAVHPAIRDGLLGTPKPWQGRARIYYGHVGPDGVLVNDQEADDFLPWTHVDVRTVVGERFISARRDSEGKVVTIARRDVGPKWVSLFDADGIQHSRVPRTVVDAYMALVDAIADHVSAEDHVSLEAAAEYAHKVLTGRVSGGGRAKHV